MSWTAVGPVRVDYSRSDGFMERVRRSVPLDLIFQSFISWSSRDGYILGDVDKVFCEA